jgi:hypothetical protein
MTEVRLDASRRIVTAVDATERSPDRWPRKGLGLACRRPRSFMASTRGRAQGQVPRQHRGARGPFVWSSGGSVPAEDVNGEGVVSHQHSHPTVDDVHGLVALKSFIAELQRAFPDFTDTVEQQIAERDL